jgi:hypothetical protein
MDGSESRLMNNGFGELLDRDFESIWRGRECGAYIEPAVDCLSRWEEECLDAEWSICGRSNDKCHVKHAVCWGTRGCVYLDIIDQMSSHDSSIRARRCCAEYDRTAAICSSR